MQHHLIGKLIIIVYMDGEPHYTGKQGMIQKVDSTGQLHGTWGGLALNPAIDKYIIVQERDPIYV
jgi:hypothetical protein